MSEFPSNLVDFGIKILQTKDPHEKAKLTQHAYKLWKSDKLTPTGKTIPSPPQKPATLDSLNYIQPGKTPKRGFGTLQNRISLIHSLCHIEAIAIDLSWDIIARFANLGLPKEYYEDWAKVANDEAMHFLTWSNRLVELGSKYGELPVHGGLWESALRTSEDLLARLVIVHCVHEARGIDITPQNIQGLKNAGDNKSAELLQKIYEDEITHVACGVKWFKKLCGKKEEKEMLECFYELVKNHFRGTLKPPFNDEARAKAGMTKEWYQPLVKK